MDLSKLLMYEFHCNYIGVIYGSYPKWLFTNTGSLVYVMKLRQMMFMKIFIKIRVCFILAILLQIHDHSKDPVNKK